MTVRCSSTQKHTANALARSLRSRTRNLTAYANRSEAEWQVDKDHRAAAASVRSRADAKQVAL